MLDFHRFFELLFFFGCLVFFVFVVVFCFCCCFCCNFLHLQIQGSGGCLLKVCACISIS